MAKLGIITTHRANNFGAILQAFSLVWACRELGSDTVILDWRFPYFENLYHCIFQPGTSLKRKLVRIVAIFTYARPMLRRYAAFRRQIPMSGKLEGVSDLNAANSMFDGFIVGSDQVWNPVNSAGRNPLKFDRANLLTFAGDKKRYAYAASIGTATIQPCSLEPEFVESWQQFSLITMREEEGARYVSSKLGHHIDTVLDPVLLHDAAWWSRIFTDYQLPRKKYVLVYNLHFSTMLDDYARDLARSIDGVVVSVMIGHALHKWRPGMVSVGPAEFLKLLAHASAVVTSSFHASAFSIVFSRELHLVVENANGNPNTRFATLTKLVGASGAVTRIVGYFTFTKFDFSEVDMSGLIQERVLSLRILKRMVG